MDEDGPIDQDVIEEEELPGLVGPPACLVEDPFPHQNPSRNTQGLACRPEATLHILDSPLVSTGVR